MGNDWKDYFEDRILERGYDYYLCGYIKNIRQVDDTVFATVNGTDDYQVIIELDEDGKPRDMECSCPYAMDYYNCKHMASVCYYIEEKDVPKVSSNNKNNDLFEYTLDYNNFVEYIDNLIDSFDFDDLKYFLNDLIVEDRNIFRQFMSFKKSFSEEDKKIYEQMLNSILYNEIKFNDNTEFIQELEDFVDVDLMLWYSNESYDFVIFLIEGILIKLATITNISETSQL